MPKQTRVEKKKKAILKALKNDGRIIKRKMDENRKVADAAVDVLDQLGGKKTHKSNRPTYIVKIRDMVHQLDDEHDNLIRKRRNIKKKMRELK